jgi:hypothetical protein
MNDDTVRFEEDDWKCCRQSPVILSMTPYAAGCPGQRCRKAHGLVVTRLDFTPSEEETGRVTLELKANPKGSGDFNRHYPRSGHCHKTITEIFGQRLS